MATTASTHLAPLREIKITYEFESFNNCVYAKGIAPGKTACRFHAHQSKAESKRRLRFLEPLVVLRLFNLLSIPYSPLSVNILPSLVLDPYFRVS